MPLLFAFLLPLLSFADDNLSEREKYLQQFAKDKSAIQKQKIADKEKPKKIKVPDKQSSDPKKNSPQEIANQLIKKDSGKSIKQPPRDSDGEDELEALNQMGGQGESMDVDQMMQNSSGPQKQMMEMAKKMFGDKNGKLDAKKIQDLQKMNPQDVMKMMKGKNGAGPNAADLGKAVNALTGMMQGQDQKAIENNLTNGKFGKIFKDNPKLKSFVAKIMRDREALPRMAKILEKKKELTNYLIVFVFTLFLGWGMKKYQNRNGEAGPVGVILQVAMRFAVLYAIRIGVFVYIFKHEMDPTIRIFKETFL